MAREQYGDVNVEVYYHPKHNYNTASIIDRLKDSPGRSGGFLLPSPPKTLMPLSQSSKRNAIDASETTFFLKSRFMHLQYLKYWILTHL